MSNLNQFLLDEGVDQATIDRLVFGCGTCGKYLPAWALERLEDEARRCGSCSVDVQREQEPDGHVFDLFDLRSERTARLLACDWSQLADQPAEIQQLWQPYRQALRDMPDTVEDLVDITWPEAPA